VLSAVRSVRKNIWPYAAIDSPAIVSCRSFYLFGSAERQAGINLPEAKTVAWMYFVVRKLGYLCAVFNQSKAEFAIKILVQRLISFTMRAQGWKADLNNSGKPARGLLMNRKLLRDCHGQL
jgi:hypothetical protein